MKYFNRRMILAVGFVITAVAGNNFFGIVEGVAQVIDSVEEAGTKVESDD